MSRWNKTSLTVLVTISLFSLFATGCSEYKTFVLSDKAPTTQAGTDFSIEYPSKYKNLFVLGAGTKWVSISNLPPGTDLDDLPDVSLGMTIVTPSDNTYQDYQEFLEDILDIARGTNPDDFEMLERTEITVDNVPGERVVYRRLRDFSPGLRDPKLSISYVVYFENKGFLWSVGINVIYEKAKEAEEDFEYIINRFRFLD